MADKKVIDCAENAFEVIVANVWCGPCSDCRLKLYAEDGAVASINCGDLKDEAEEWIEEHYKEALAFIDSLGKPKPPEPTPEPVPDCGNCADCINREEIPGGYLMCKTWHNFTKPGGFCHNYLKGGAE